MGYRELGMHYRGDTVAPVDGAADDPSLRTLGSDPTQAAPGDVLTQIPSDPAIDTPGLRRQPRGIVGVGPGDVHGHVYPTAATSAGIAASVAAIGANIKTLDLEAKDFAISVPTTVPAGIHVIAHAGTRFVRSGTGTLHFDAFDAPLVQVFFGFSSGQVTFGHGVREAPPQWFGISDGISDDAAAIAMVTASMTRGTLLLSPGDYLCASAWSIPAGIRLRVDQGAMVTQGGGGTIAVAGPVTAPDAQWLSGFVDGEVTFARVADPSPYWWSDTP